MNAKEFRYKVDRRRFLSHSACASVGLGGMIQTLSNLMLMDRALAATDVVGNDYRALVCIFLRGGSDTNNMIIPRVGNPQASLYQTNRGVIGVPNGVSGPDNTVPITPDNDNGFGTVYGLHPSFTRIASMFAGGDLSFITNAGTLAMPVTPANYNTAVVPVQLFSHSDQVTQWMAGSEPQKPFTSGFGGRIADLIHDTANPDSQTSMLITVAGNNQFEAAPGGSIPQYSVTTTGPVSLTGFQSAGEPPYFDAIDPGTGKYRNDNTGFRLKAFENVMHYVHSHILEEGYNTVVRRARANEATVGAAITAADALDGVGAGLVDFTGLFSNANVNAGNTLALQLKMVAQLIAGRKTLGNKRQIFFVDQGGHDTHQDLNADQPVLLDNIDRAVWAFHQALSQLDGIDDFSINDVVSFQASDFNRTWTPNGSDPLTSGSDHAWGTNTFVFGGPVKGKRFFGTHPSLVVGGPNDVPQGTRGRWIPTTAVDQIASVLAEWIGVAPADLNTIFPGRQNFETNPVTANIDFIDMAATTP